MDSKKFIQSVVADFPEYSKGLASMTLEPDSTLYALSLNLIVSYDRIQHITSIREYLSDHAKIMKSKDMIIITTAGPYGNPDTESYFEPRTMREIREGLDLDQNFVDWELRYADNNSKLLCWAIKA